MEFYVVAPSFPAKKHVCPLEGVGGFWCHYRIVEKCRKILPAYTGKTQDEIRMAFSFVECKIAVDRKDFVVKWKIICEE